MQVDWELLGGLQLFQAGVDAAVLHFSSACCLALFCIHNLLLDWWRTPWLQMVHTADLGEQIHGPSLKQQQPCCCNSDCPLFYSARPSMSAI